MATNQTTRPVPRTMTEAENAGKRGALVVQGNAREAPIAVGPAARIATPEQLGAVAERVLGSGDLAQMDATQRARYLLYVCQLLGLNPFTRPFEIIKFQNATVLYARKEATEQLARNFGVATEVKRRAPDEFLGVYMTEVRASYRRADGSEVYADALGAVPYVDGAGKMVPVAERANVAKKSETQARRRAVLGLLGLGIFDRAGERDPDLIVDGRGAIGARTQRELPTSSATSAEIFRDEPPDTYRGGAAMRAEAAAATAAEEILTPTDEEMAAASAQVAAGEAPTVSPAVRVEHDGARIIARGSRRSLAVRAAGLSEVGRGAVGSALLRWIEVTDADVPAPPAEDESEAAWSAWVDQVGAALDGSGGNG